MLRYRQHRTGLRHPVCIQGRGWKSPALQTQLPGSPGQAHRHPGEFFPICLPSLSRPASNQKASWALKSQVKVKLHLALKQKMFLLHIQVSAAQTACPVHIPPHPGNVSKPSVTLLRKALPASPPPECQEGSRISLGLEGQVRLLPNHHFPSLFY